MLNVRLEMGEKILYETDRVTLTNKRLIANLEKRSNNLPTDDVALSDVASFKKMTGGQESRMRQGVIALVVGLVLTLVQLTLRDSISFKLDGFLFMASALFLLGGVYFTLSSMLRIRPNTLIVFSVVGSRDIPVRFPGKDSPLADEMTRLFVRTRRGLN